MRLSQLPLQHVKKGWGYELWIVNNLQYCGKLLHVLAGKKGSLHFHLKKDETFYLQSGQVDILLVDKDGVRETVNLRSGQRLHIPPGLVHQIIGIEDSDLFEFSTTHSDADSFRVEKGD